MGSMIMSGTLLWSLCPCFIFKQLDFKHMMDHCPLSKSLSFACGLARRALRALKALVKLQALVRGHIVRKQTADMLRRMQTLVRLQARARASRASHVSDSFPSSSSPRSLHTRCVSNSELREIIAMDHRSQVGSSRLDHWSEETLWTTNKNNSSTSILHMPRYNEDEEGDDKILEVDTWKPHLASRPFRSDSSHHNNNESPRKRQPPVVARSAENSPQVGSSRPGSSSGSRRRTPFTPTRTEYSWGCYGGNYYTGYYPNYMANTESYRAKVRSQSAPRQRLEFADSNKRSVQGHYYYYAAAEGSFDQRSDVGSSGQGGGLSERLNRNTSGRSKMTMHSSLLI
ncbi:PREDICTED: uncharacterized protein LOC104801888 [Tarenaya hassleriana]|uniref:uncharacterized protein LOC104801888 n=1 Tax=Tarenaya hassleriana TaxID=28532 RepID=UPI00053C45B1|nr:PREDICTED: uncharacterized protein LOC104801888 [Tarenaya hassleriana]